MRVIVSERAKKQLKRIDKFRQIILVSKLKFLETGDEIADEEKLSGYSDMYRVRVGDYRVVYKRSKMELHVVLIGHRKEVYKLLGRLLG